MECSQRFIEKAYVDSVTFGLLRSRYWSINPCTVTSARLWGCFEFSSALSPPLPTVTGVIKSAHILSKSTGMSLSSYFSLV